MTSILEFFYFFACCWVAVSLLAVVVLFVVAVRFELEDRREERYRRSQTLGLPREPRPRVTDEATTRVALYPSRRQALLSGAVGLAPRWRDEDQDGSFMGDRDSRNGGAAGPTGAGAVVVEHVHGSEPIIAVLGLPIATSEPGEMGGGWNPMEHCGDCGQHIDNCCCESWAEWDRIERERAEHGPRGKKGA